MFQRGIRHGDYPNQALLPVQDGQAADLVLAHVLDHMVDILVLEAIFHVLGHDLADLRVRALARRQAAHDDVAVGDHADDAIMIADRQVTDVAFRHDLRDFADGLARAGQDHVAAHDVLDLHDDTSSSTGTRFRVNRRTWEALHTSEVCGPPIAQHVHATHVNVAGPRLLGRFQ
jgi:hypothetical protein